MRQSQLFNFLILFSAFIISTAQASEDIWVLIDTQKLTLEVKQGQKTLAMMNNISLGKNGAGIKTHKGDEVTPLGSYTIGWINNKSRFHRFYGFTYPSLQNARIALLDGFLSEKEYNRIVNAHKKKKIPPQNTSLGGQIGIHGLGRASKRIHQLLNWTRGCIALTNQQIDQLARWVGKGTKVTVK